MISEITDETQFAFDLLKSKTWRGMQMCPYCGCFLFEEWVYDWNPITFEETHRLKRFPEERGSGIEQNHVNNKEWHRVNCERSESDNPQNLYV